MKRYEREILEDLATNDIVNTVLLRLTFSLLQTSGTTHIDSSWTHKQINKSIHTHTGMLYI